jgi:putative oxidoreductase
MNLLQNLAAPAGRFLLAIMFFLSGITKISQYEGTQGYMEAMGVPGALLPLVIITEAVGGLAIIFGYKTRYVALALAGFSALSAILFHADFSNQAEMTNFMKNFAIAGGFLTLVVHGAGSFSLDNRFAKAA